MSSPDFDDIATYLDTRVSRSNKAQCMRVIKKLMHGEGIAHKNKPGEVFMQGVPVTLDMDLVAIREDAKLWLPCSGPNALDKGHGWALSHPLGWLQKYKTWQRLFCYRDDINGDDPNRELGGDPFYDEE